jgi:kynurenine formamidase
MDQGLHPGRAARHRGPRLNAGQRWLSHPLGVDDPRPPAIPAPELSDLYTIAREGARVHLLRVANHTGTHLDAPAHVIDGGLTIVDFAPEELVYRRPALIDLRLPEAAVVEPRDLAAAVVGLDDPDLLLVRFGCGELRARDPAAFSTRCPGLGRMAARWLRERFPRLRAIGLDVPSIACIARLDETMVAHHELLSGEGRRFLIVEDMRLDAELVAPSEVRLWPWLVRGMDSGPCAAVGLPA